jgi:hypothetical protein
MPSLVPQLDHNLFPLYYSLSIIQCLQSNIQNVLKYTDFQGTCHAYLYSWIPYSDSNGRKGLPGCCFLRLSVSEMDGVCGQGGLWDAPGSFAKQTSLTTWDSKVLADVFPELSPVGQKLIRQTELWIMSNNPCNRATLIFIYDYLIMVLESQITRTMSGRMIDEWLTVKAVKDKGHGLYLEDSKKAMQVAGITPWTSLGLTLKKSWQGINIYSNRYFHGRNKTGTIIMCRTILPYSTQLIDPSLTQVLVWHALHSGSWIYSILRKINGCYSSQCKSFCTGKKDCHQYVKNNDRWQMLQQIAKTEIKSAKTHKTVSIPYISLMSNVLMWSFDKTDKHTARCYFFHLCSRWKYKNHKVETAIWGKEYVIFKTCDENNTNYWISKKNAFWKKKSRPWKPTYMIDTEILYFYHSDRFETKSQIPKPKI